jgi:hypothetical protein
MWFDAAGLTGGLLGLPSAGAGPSAAATDSSSPDTVLEAALIDRDGSPSSSSPLLLAVSLLILLAIAGGVAVRWWDRRPDRYWPA